ncbi:type II secretion system protein GspL [Xylophilus ampelinus]|uniref:General secretion pathway protein L n=1 Tax=Xylophilus ampelinus TaxID=54067 RepID=A0A318SEZ7_9BURK|nr:type II secretion system protein GspL [Xylophilus ampelinus]MCS4511021.1 type II secretion system protein GspL [Xylophilus ampelinus]PYE75985.1 general secretion pathway protein L [Xylophilus ampelinus]
MSTLIVYLPPDAGAVDLPYVLTADGHAALRQASARPALLPQPGRPGGEVVAVVPARALSWQRVELPRGIRAGSPPQRVRAVLDGLLEDRLLDDPAHLHFALAPDAAPGVPAWVAVCDRAWLRNALQRLEAAGRRVARIVPEFAPDDAALPQPRLHAVGTPEDAQLVVVGERYGTAVSVLPLSAGALGLALSGRPADADAPPPLFWAEPAVAALAEQLAGRPLPLQTPAERWLVAARGRWDLAQFDLASSGRRRAVKRAGSLMAGLLRAPQWRAARWGLGVLLVAQLVGLNAWAWKERSALDARQSALHAVLTQTFPSVRVVVDAPVQMERELALLRQATGVGAGAGLEGLLSAVGTALPPGASVQSVDFLNDELRLRGFDPAQVAPLVEKLRAQGIAAGTEGEVLVLRQEGMP